MLLILISISLIFNLKLFWIVSGRELWWYNVIMALFVYFVYHCRPYIFLISMKPFLLHVCTIMVDMTCFSMSPVFQNLLCIIIAIHVQSYYSYMYIYMIIYVCTCTSTCSSHKTLCFVSGERYCVYIHVSTCTRTIHYWLG